MRGIKTNFPAYNIKFVRKWLRGKLARGYKIGEYLTDDGNKNVMLYLNKTQEAEWIMLNLAEPPMMTELIETHNSHTHINNFRVTPAAKYAIKTGGWYEE